MDQHYQQAKNLLTMAANLNHPDPNAPLALTCDASKLAVGAVMEQMVEGQWVPLGYWSRHLTPDKQRWSTFRRETYAIQQAIRHFLAEVNGRHLTYSVIIVL